ncbi:transporter substrate-binding domain-containing protein [Mesorhizobium onobrychidis]|uniref:Transporter substrate-binding domain-containing protein n=1 Tax=Mesorhizobium onobrychidis TaxID=2775404 RepID=A0ABY5R919_9HYPH|nr:transporter substrate-binding domain-containing protein [Mesorhizobium onobrychidis]UVC19301.1 transporter substrate-binding domain-containing protein [Mesorhizobium onobrychidis]
MRVSLLIVAMVLLDALMPGAARADPAQKPDVVIGARIDARPFVWRNPATKAYSGFLLDICTKSVVRAGFQFTVVDVDADKRVAFLQRGEGDYDLLCDPTTINLARMETFTGDGEVGKLSFSPIVFVANGSFVAQKPEREKETGKTFLKGTYRVDVKNKAFGCNDLKKKLTQGTGHPADYVDATIEDSQLKPFLTLRRPDPIDTKMFAAYGYVRGSTIGEQVQELAKRSGEDGLKICEDDYASHDLATDASCKGHLKICADDYASHDLAAEAFCKGRLARYFGDLDIITASLATYEKRHNVRCEAAAAPASAGTTYEPYALVASTRRFPDFPERLAYALYGMFQDGTIEGLFNGHFPGVQKSDHLKTLFAINSIPTGAAAISASEDTEISGRR